MPDTYSEMERLFEVVEPYVNFIDSISYDEFSQQQTALLQAAEACSSAADYDFAYLILNQMHENLVIFVHESWWDDMIARADYDYEEGLKRFSEEEQKRQRTIHAKPSDVVNQLPNLEI